MCSWKQLPQEQQKRLRDGDRPDRTVEIAPFDAFALRRSPDARQNAEYPKKNNDCKHREIPDVVDLLQNPLSTYASDDQTREIQKREVDQRVPGKRVADPAIQRIRLVFTKAQDVRLWLNARQLAEQTCDAGSDHHHAKPHHIANASTTCKQIERKRTGNQKEYP